MHTKTELHCIRRTNLLDWHNRHFPSISGSIIMCITLFEFCYIVGFLLHSYQWSGPQKFNHFRVPCSVELVIDCVSIANLAEVNTFSVICGKVKGFICFLQRGKAEVVISFNYGGTSLHWFFHQCNYFWMGNQMLVYTRIIEHFSPLLVQIIPEKINKNISLNILKLFTAELNNRCFSLHIQLLILLTINNKNVFQLS